MATTSESNLPIKRITHVTIAVSDMERALAFYRQVLGWKLIDDTQVDLAALAAVVGPNATCRALVGRVANLGIELISGSFIPSVKIESSHFRNHIHIARLENKPVANHTDGFVVLFQLCIAPLKPINENVIDRFRFIEIFVECYRPFPFASLLKLLRKPKLHRFITFLHLTK